MLRPSRLRLMLVAICLLTLVAIGATIDISSRAGNVDPALVPSITASMPDQLLTDVDGDGRADPGDTIKYTVTITNNGTDATGTAFNDTLDPNLTLVAGSLSASPITANDAYTATGNVRISVPDGAGDLLGNDINPLTGTNTGLTATAQTVSSANCTGGCSNNVVIAANGSFTYNPPAGFEGADTFNYSATDGTSTTTGTATVTVSGMIWFVNSSAAAGGDGRLTAPYNCLVGAGCFSTSANDPGDNVFLYSGSYTGGLTLKTTQKIIGQGATSPLATVAGITLAPNSDALPTTSGANPTVTTTVAATSAFTLSTGNTLRGFDIGNTTAADIAGTSFGTLTVADMSLNGTGRTLDLNNGTLAATFATIASTSSSSQGLVLQTVAGSLTVTGGTTIGGNSTQCILVSGSTVNASFGNTSCTSGTDGISLQNNASGTRTFGTLSVSGGSGNAFLHAVGGGSVTVTGAATLSSALDAISINSPGAANALNFQGATSATRTSAGGNGVAWVGTAGATATFSSLTIQTNGGTGLNATVGGTFNVTNATGTVNNTTQTAPAIVANAVALNANFLSVNSSGGTNGISLTNVGGTSNFGSGALSGASGATFLVSGGAGSVTYNGTVTQGNAARVVDVQSKTGGNVTFGGAVSSTGGTGTGILLNNNTGATITFSGGMALTTNANTAFTATAGGTVNVCDENPCNPAATGALINTLTTTTGTALNVANTTIGTNNLEFRSISVNGAPAGIILSSTGSSGGLSVKGIGTTDASGGTIQNNSVRGINASNTSNMVLKNMAFTNANTADGPGPCGAADNSGCNAAIFINTGTNVTFDNVDINGTAEQGINLKEINGFQLLNSSIINAGTSSSGADTEEAGVYGVNVFGTSAINNTNITFSAERNAVFYNTNKTLAMTVNGSHFDDTQLKSLGADGFEISSFGTSNTTLDFVNCNFLRPKTNGLQVITENNSFTSVDITGSTFDPGTGLAAAIDLDTNTAGDMDFNISGNTIKARGINVVNIFGFPNSTFEGRITNNTIINGSGSGVGVRVIDQGNGNSKVAITNNNITGADDYGIVTSANSGTGRLDSTITGNTVTVGAAGFYGIQTIAGASSSTFTNKVCSNVANNTVTPNPLAIGHFQARAATASHEMILQGSGPNVASNWNANTNSPLSPTAIVSQSGGGTFTFGTVCATPANPLPFAGRAANALANRTVTNGDEVVFLQSSEIPIFDSPTAPTFTADGETSGSKVETASNIAPTSEYVMVAEATYEPAVERPQTAKTDLAPTANEIFAKIGGLISPTVYSQTTDKAAGGAEDRPDSGETITVNGSGAGFTLPASKSVTISFSATVGNAQPAFTQVSNQGTVSGSNFASVLTDDPNVAGAANPTVRLVDNTTVAVTSNANPSVFGQSVTLTATMTGVPSRASDPPGTVQFKADGNPIGSPVAVVAGTANDNVSTAQVSISSLSLGNHVITAEYSGGGTGATGYNANRGTLSGGQVVNQAATTVSSFLASNNPVVFGQPATFTATITPTLPGTGSPTGNVTFKDNNVTIGSCAAQTVTANVATCTISSLSVATHPITAVYNGDTNFSASPVSGSIPLVVNKASTTLGVTSSANPSPVNNNVTFTATIGITSPGAGTTTGTVQFLDGGNPIAGCTASTVAAGQAQCVTNALTLGNHTITAQYSGDSSFNSSSGSLIGNPQVINAAVVSRADFDGDGRSDLSIFRPSEGNWYVNGSTTGFAGIHWGLAGDTVLPGDYDGDGKADFALWRPSDTVGVSDYFILNSNGFTIKGYSHGLTTDVPVAGDFDGDGKADIVVWRPSTGVWYLFGSVSQTTTSAQFGSPGDIPFAMDKDGDGKANLTVYRPSDRTFYMANSTGVPAQSFTSAQWGLAGDILVPADYDGDNKDDVAVFRPSNGVWYVLRSSDGQVAYTQFGVIGDIPVPGDYDGDGKDDIAVFRSGTWYLNRSTSGFAAQVFGLATDIPIASRYRP